MLLTDTSTNDVDSLDWFDSLWFHSQARAHLSCILLVAAGVSHHWVDSVDSLSATSDAAALLRDRYPSRGNHDWCCWGSGRRVRGSLV